MADGLTCAFLVEFDPVGQDYILKIASGVDISGVVKHVYKQYTYDSNDSFADDGDIASAAPGKYGEPVTMAAWVTDMATLIATSLAAGVDGVCDDVTHVDMSATPVASVQRHTNSN